MTTPALTDAPVLVTGSTGFISAHIVKDLLARGYRVRGTVRSLQREEQLAPLRALPGAAERLELFEAHLLDAAAFTRAAAGCEYVLHTASPYALDVEDAQRDLVDPAVNGTRNVLSACQQAGTVKRVVVTSSMAAITDEPDANKELSEADWNERSSLQRNPYYFSKTEAEREAWRFAKEEGAAFDVVTINPFVVLGPSLGKGLNTSNKILVDLVSGVYPGIIRLTWGVVDVRDVALAHVLAMESPAASGRYLCANTTLRMRELVEWLRGAGYERGYKLPKLPLDSPLGDVAVRLGSYLQPKGVRSYILTHIGRTPRFSNAKIREELGLAFRPVEETLADTMQDLVRWGHISPPARP